MAESVSFNWNGVDRMVATITGASIGVEYHLTTNAAGTEDDEVAASSTVVLTMADVATPPGATFGFEVTTGVDYDIFAGCTVVSEHISGEYAFPATWHYDGVNTVTVTGKFPSGGSCLLYVFGHTFYADTTIVGTGSSQTLTLVSTSTGDPIVGSDRFDAGVIVGGNTFTTRRMFVPGTAGAGLPGNPSSLLTPSSSGSLTSSPASKGSLLLTPVAAGSQTLTPS